MVTVILFTGITVYACYKFYNWVHTFNPYDFATSSLLQLVVKLHTVLLLLIDKTVIKISIKNLIFFLRHAKTGQGKVGIVFIDNTRVDVTEHSKLLIDEFVYDPNTKTGALSLKAN